MDLKIFATTFVTIFIAELGDKTQFAAMAVGASDKNTFSVWLAVVAALAVAGSLGVLAGSILDRFINPAILSNIAGGLFIAMGVWLILK